MTQTSPLLWTWRIPVGDFVAPVEAGFGAKNREMDDCTTLRSLMVLVETLTELLTSNAQHQRGGALVLDNSRSAGFGQCWREAGRI